MIRFAVLTLVASFALAGCGDGCETGDFTEASPTELQRAILKAEAPWMKHAKTCNIGGYNVMGPAEGATGDIVVTRNGTTVLIDELGQIHLQAKDGSLVSVHDRNGTGHFDWVSYSVIDSADGKPYDVTDADSDGQLDLKSGSDAFFVNINGEWSRFEKHENQIGAIVSGEWRALEKHGRKYRLKSQ